MTLYDRYMEQREEGRQEGRQEGAHVTMVRNVKNTSKILENLGLGVEEIVKNISENFGIPKSQVREML